MKKDEKKPNIKKLINKSEKTSDSIWEVKDPLEEALIKSNDEVLAKAIQDMLSKDMLH